MAGKRSISLVQQDRDAAVGPIGVCQVEITVSVKVGGKDCIGGATDRITVREHKRAVPVVEQNGDVF